MSTSGRIPTTTFVVDDSIALVTLVRALASAGLTVTGDRRGGLVVTTPERAAQFHGRDLRAACADTNPSLADIGAGGAHSEQEEWRQDDDRQRARDINAERRLLGF
jgi:hypothetical protein